MAKLSQLVKEHKKSKILGGSKIVTRERRNGCSSDYKFLVSKGIFFRGKKIYTEGIMTVIKGKWEGD